MNQIQQTSPDVRYFGITIGPITRILSYAKATRGIWAASYFFSWLAKDIVNELIKSGHTIDDFIKPTIHQADLDTEDMVGRFPDQYIFRAKDDETLGDIRTAIDKGIENKAKRLEDVLDKDAIKVEEYLKNVLRITAFEVQLSGTTKEIVDQMQSYMGILDCRDAFQSEMPTGEDYLMELLDKKTDINVYRKLFFGAMKEKDVEEKLPGFKNLQQLDKEKPYVAFVMADGDNFGLNNSLISDYLTAFNKELPELVNRYGGQVIYQGGDDISFYAPLTLKGGTKDIFALISEIDNLFQEKVISKVPNPTWANNIVPSFSYGIAIGYERHPMNETRKRAEDLLEKAKSDKVGKNAICWEMRKHSGQTSGGTISKQHKDLQANTSALITDAVKGKTGKSEDANFLHSLTHGIVAYKELLHNILSSGADKALLLDNFFHNVYGDNYKQYKAQLDTAQKILLDDCFTTPSDAVTYLHNMLRYIELLLRKEDER